MAKYVDVIIEEDGQVKVEAHGFKGKDCVKETQFIRDALGKTISRNLKAVYHKANVRKHLPLCG